MRASLPDMFLQHLPANDRAVHVAFGIDADAFCAAMLRGRRLHVFDEVLHGSVLCAADTDSLFPTGLIRPPGFGIGDIDGVIARDRNTDGTSELAPRR